MPAKKVVLIVVDGMTPAAFERAVDGDRAPALAYLAAHGDYRRGVSVFPSLTPVCLSSIATGGGPHVHHIPHLVWWHRAERRIVEYGSSFSALRAAGLTQSITDTVYNMNRQHLAADAVTVYEALDDAGFVSAAVNITCYRGHTRYVSKVPWLTRIAFGPKRFFYYGVFESDKTGAPPALRSRATGSTDAYAAAVGRWLVTRDGFDFFAYYLSDFDYTSHLHGPAVAEDVSLARIDAAVQTLLDAAGGGDAFLERYAVVVASDHGQTQVEQATRLDVLLAPQENEIVVAASNRAGQVYLLPGARVDAPGLAARLDGEPSVEIALWREGDHAVARREGEELRFRPVDGVWETRGDESILDHPDAFGRSWSALADPNAGELLVSATEGWEFADLGGRHHAGGGSHGSLVEGDSLVPLLTIGVEAEINRITEITPAVLAHFGVGATLDAV